MRTSKQMHAVGLRQYLCIYLFYLFIFLFIYLFFSLILITADVVSLISQSHHTR